MGAGIRFLTHDQLKVVDAASEFRESKLASGLAPVPPQAESLSDSPRYHAWKKFPVGARVTYESRQYTEVQPGAGKYQRLRISQTTFQLNSIDAERAVLTSATTTWNPRGGVFHSTGDHVYKTKETVPPMELPGNPSPDKIQTTRGEETLVISGQSVPTKWERISTVDAPENYIKTWTSDQVPGGTVLQRSQLSRASGRTAARTIGELIYAPIQGVEPEVTSGSAMAELGALPKSNGGTPGAAPTPAPPASSRQEAPPQTSTRSTPTAAPRPAAAREAVSGRSGGAEPNPVSANEVVQWNQRYRTSMLRMQRASSELARRRYVGGRTAPGLNIPQEVKEASDRMQAESRAVYMDMTARNYTRVAQSMAAFESTLKVIEEYLAK
jgi:hypothetical protein